MPENDPYTGPEYEDAPRRPARRTSQEEHSSARPLAYLLILAIGVGFGALGLWLGGKLLHQGPPEAVTDPNARPKEAVANPPLDAEENEAHTLFMAVKPSVVNVYTILPRRLADGSRQFQHSVTGSGFVWDQDGRIVTNFHVVEQYAEAQQQYGKQNPLNLRVTMADRTEYPAAIVGISPNHDLAVIQISAPKDKLSPIQLATSSDLQVGQKVFAIGNPFDLSLTLTKGIISALGRTIESDKQRGAPITGAIQHQAPINPGNSGGPLLNRFSKLIGVNTSITSPSGGNVGIGFAIPSDTVNQVVTEIIRTGRTIKPDLGVRLYDQRRLRAAGYDQGVMIAEVIPGGPADQAKLRGLRRNQDTGRAEPGDIILAINGQPVNGVDDFQKIVSGLKPGQQVKVKYLRVEGNNETEKEATVTVGGV